MFLSVVGGIVKEGLNFFPAKLAARWAGVRLLR